MLLLSRSVGNGVFLRMRSGRNCVILTIVPGLGQPSMASTVTRSSQKSPDIRTIGFSFLLPVFGATTPFAMPCSTAYIGRRPSLRAIRASRAASTSIQATSAVYTTTGTTVNPSVPSQNKN